MTYTLRVTPPRQPLLVARERAGFTCEEMAFLVDLTSSELIAFERGESYPPPQVVERFATALGLSVRELLAGEEPTAVALLFRRMSRENGPFVEAVDTGLPAALGGFVRVTREIARLRAFLGEAPKSEQLAWLDHFKPKPPVSRVERRQEFYEEVQSLARGVRDFLGLSDTGEISSMRRLVGELGIITRFVDPHQLDARIDGASFLGPHPAILVTLLGGGEKWWHTRMTLAHELCHLLFDRAELDPEHRRRFFVFSPNSPNSRSRRPPRWHLFEHFEDLEARANAFAGEFLAPTTGVRRLVSAANASSPESVALLCDHYKIGWETAVNRLTNTFSLSEDQRQRMLDWPPLLRDIKKLVTHPDRVEPRAQSLHDSYFVDLVMRALAGAKIDAIEARALLNLRLSDPLPDHPAAPLSQRAPLRAREEPARRAAEDHLYRNFGLEYFVDSVASVDEGWRAQVCCRESDGAIASVGALILGADLSIRDDSSLMSATA